MARGPAGTPVKMLHRNYGHAEINKTWIFLFFFDQMELVSIKFPLFETQISKGRFRVFKSLSGHPDFSLFVMRSVNTSPGGPTRVCSSSGRETEPTLVVIQSSAAT